ncbi:hypothetical protein MKC73_08700 [[Clostridium] innocuum]|nr:hypothetical protein [[Clostridium] innocuum]
MILLIIVVSNIIGNYFYEKLNIERKVLPFVEGFGFIVFIAVYQIFIYIPQLFHLHTFFNSFTIILIFLITLVLIKFNFKKYFVFNNLLLIPIGLAIVFLLIMYMNPGTIWVNNTSDSAFYLPLINDNSIPNHLNSINPSTGTAGNVLYIYAFQGINQFLGGLSMLFHLKGALTCMWLIPFISNFLFFGLIINLYYITERKGKLLLFLLIFVGIHAQFTEFNFTYLFYPTSLRPVMFYNVFLWLIYYTKCGKSNINKNGIMFIFISIANIAVHSSSLFIMLMSSIALFVSELILAKEKNYIPSFYLALPVLLNAFFIYIYKGVYWIAILAFFTLLISILFKKYLFIFLEKKEKLIKFIIIFTFSLLIFSRFYIKDAPLNFSDFFNNNKNGYVMNFIELFTTTNLKDYTINKFVNLLDIIILLYSIYWLTYKTKILYANKIGQFAIAFCILFYNPFSIVYVSKFLTYEVYFRIEIGVFNIFIIMLLFSLLSLNKFLKISLLLVYLSSTFSECTHFFDNSAIKYMNENFNIIKAYKLDKDLVDLGKFFDQYEVKNKISIPSSAINIRMYSPYVEIDKKYTLNLQRKKKDTNSLIDYLENNNSQFNMDVFETVLKDIQNENSNFIVINNNLKPEVYNALIKIYKLSYKNEKYIVFKRGE